MMNEKLKALNELQQKVDDLKKLIGLVENRGVYAALQDMVNHRGSYIGLDTKRYMEQMSVELRAILYIDLEEQQKELNERLSKLD